MLNFHGPVHKGLSDILVVSAVLSQHISILFWGDMENRWIGGLISMANIILWKADS